MSKSRIMSFEGQLLSTVGMADTVEVAAVARDMVDAGTNILVRLEGSHKAAEFTFALSDRIVGQIRDETLRANHSEQVPQEAPQDHPVAPKERRMSFWAIYFIGWICGAAIGISVGKGIP